MKPATALPWELDDEFQICALPGRMGSVIVGNVEHLDVGRDDADQNAAYIVHAANAYPKLVEALRRYLRVNGTDADAFCRADDIALALLKELGE